MKKTGLIILALFMFTAPATAQVTWEIDKVHSEVGFSVKHLMISNVRGKFTDYDITFKSKSDKNFEDAKIEAVLRTASINTNNEGRDKHLRSDDFLNDEKYPEIRFKSTSFRKTGENKYKVYGPLTIRDVTKNVELDAVFNGTADFRGKTISSFSVTGEIDRFDYNVKFNRAMETGGLIVDQIVRFAFELEFGSSNGSMSGQ